MKTNNSIYNFNKLMDETTSFDDIFDNNTQAEQFLNEKLALIKQLNFKAKVELGKMKSSKVAANYAEKIADLYNSGKNEMRELLQAKILSYNPQFQFRKLEKLDASDLKDLLDDVEMLKIIENLEENEQ